MDRFTSAEGLMQFFALFYTGVSLSSFLVQAILTPRLLDRMDLGAGLGGFPLALASAGLLGLVWPGLVAQAVLRGADGALVHSLYRSSYEPLYTPIAPDDKRAAKAVIDVLVNRVGDGAGSLIEAVDIHHIFPEDWCKKQNIAPKVYDTVVNKTPLAYRTNRIIGGVAPSKYLQKLEHGSPRSSGKPEEPPSESETLDSYLRSHCIPVDVGPSHLSTEAQEQAPRPFDLRGHYARLPSSGSRTCLDDNLPTTPRGAPHARDRPCGGASESLRRRLGVMAGPWVFQAS